MMQRDFYFNYVNDKLSSLSTSINNAGKLNVLNLHLHSENFYQYFLNLLYDWNLEDSNQKLQNVEAIDLVSHNDKIVTQISATCTKDKIESSLDKEIMKNYPGYTFKFISIAKDASSLRKKDSSYKNPHNIDFVPQADIFDQASILRYIKSLDIDKQKLVYEFIKKELGGEVNTIKLDSNLTAVINILAEEDWDKDAQRTTVNSFEIDRKIAFNDLKSASRIINNYKIHYSRVDNIYDQFDTMGVNKSNSVLAVIESEYLKNVKIKSDDELFFLVMDNVRDRVLQSPNFVEIPSDELDLCINILVVDAFIRCKIFENPNNYKYATT